MELQNTQTLNEKTPLIDAFKQKKNVMHAVILRDIRSRAFNHGLGFLIVPFLPLAHLGILLAFYTLLGRDTPFGEDLRVFFATGLIPALLFMYVSRFMSVSVLSNKSIMAFPVVRLLDIVLARAFLELIGIILAVLLMLSVLVIFGSEIAPSNPAQIVLAMLATVLLAIGMGIIASVITAIYPFFAMIYALSMVLFYITSGPFLYLHAFPAQIIEIVAWNPVFHSVEWMRSAYYLGYSDQYLDRTFLINYGIISLTIGLFLERHLRPQMLASN